MLPLCFARLEFKVKGLEFKVCKGQPFLNQLYKIQFTCFTRSEEQFSTNIFILSTAYKVHSFLNNFCFQLNTTLSVVFWSLEILPSRKCLFCSYNSSISRQTQWISLEFASAISYLMFFLLMSANIHTEFSTVSGEGDCFELTSLLLSAFHYHSLTTLWFVFEPCTLIIHSV